MKIRLLQPEDGAAVLAMADRAFGEGFFNLEALTEYTVYVAEEDNKIVGYASHFLRESNIYNIDQVVVDPSHRRRGIAQRLITQLIEDIDDLTAVIETQAWEYSDTKKVPLATPLEECGFHRVRLLERIYETEHGEDAPCSVCGPGCVCNAWLYRHHF